MGLSIRQGKLLTNKLIFSVVAVFALVAQPMYGLVASQVASAVSATVGTETELRNALGEGKTEINLSGNIGVNNQISINYSTTFNGGTITALAPGTYGSDDAVVYVSGTGVVFTASNTVFDGNNQGSKPLFGGNSSDKRRQGVKVYGGATANLNSVTIKNAKKSGLHVNGSSVANVKDITTSGNGALFGGLVVSGGGIINVDGKSTHNGEYVPARIDGSGTINDSNDQYTAGNTRWLKSAPGAPAITAPASPVTTSTADLTWTAPSTSGNKNAAESYLVSINGGADVSVSGLTHSLTGLTDGNYIATVQSVAKSGLLGGTATHNFTVAIPDIEKPEGSAVYNGGYVAPSGVRYVQKIEDLSFTVNATDNKGVAWATYRAWNVAQSGVEACGNWNTGAPTDYIFAAPLQTSIPYTVPGSSVKTCDSSMKWETGSRYQFIHAVYDAAGNESEKFNSTNQLVEIDSAQPVISIGKPLAKSTVNGIVPVEVKITENGSGVKYVNALFTDGLTPEFGHTALTLKPSTTDTYVGQIDTTGKDGKFSLGINVSDNVGNMRSAKAQNITIDNTPPAVPYDLSFKMSNGGVRSSGGWANLPKGDVTWNHSNQSDVKSYIYYSWTSITGSKWHEDNKWKTPNITSKNLNGVVFNQGEGKYFFCVAAVDALGNESACSETFEIGYDKTNPTVTVTTPSGPIDTTKTFAISGKYSDNLSGVGRLHLYASANGKEVVFYVSALDSTPNDEHDYSYNLTPADLAKLKNDLNLQDGQTLTIKARVYDRANNSSNTTSTITSDTAAPKITISIAEVTEGEETKISGTVEDTNLGNEAVINVNKKDYPVNLNEGKFTLTLTGDDKLPVGSHEVTVKSTDKAGNTGEATATAVVNPAPVEPTTPVLPVSPTQPTGQSTPLIRSTLGAQSPLAATPFATIIGGTDAADAEDDTPTAAVRGATDSTSEDESKKEVLAAKDSKEDWSLVNLILTILIVGLGAAGIRKLAATDKEQRKLTGVVLAGLVAVGSVVALLMVENFTGNMIWFNTWSLLLGGLAVAQVAIISMIRPAGE